MRYPDPETLRQQAQGLRREELKRVGCLGAIKWRALVDSVRRLAFAGAMPARNAPKPNAPYSCQSTAPTHS